MNDFLISGSFIIEPLRETLDFWVQEIPLTCKVKFSPYNQLFQTLATSPIHADAIFVLIRDKDLFHSTNEDNFYLFIHYLRHACHFTSASIFVIDCPTHAEEEWGSCLKKEIQSISGAYYVQLREWLDRYGVSDFFDFKTEELAHIPYTSAVYGVLGTLIARIIYTLQFSSIKLIGVDCDNTLWSGVVAEENITIHVEFQRWLLDLHDKGIAIALFSKNEIEDVQAVFEDNSDMVLPKEAIVAWYVNWMSKGENLSHLIKTLNISSDSVLFLDDNPIECAAISAFLPEVVVVRFESSLFHHIWDIPIYHKGTTEDLERSNRYKQHLKREDLRQASKSFSEFINSLNLRVQISLIRQNEIERVAQLTQRTNQFNASTRRRRSQQIQAFVEKKGSAIYVIHVEDRFGNYGLVGAIFLEDKESALVVDTFLLSCRVLGRGIEYQMVSFIGKLAYKKWVIISYCETKRNGPIKMFLEALNPLKCEGEDYVFEPETLVKAAFKPDEPLPLDSLVPDIKTKQATSIDRSNLAKLTTSLKTVQEIRSKMRKSNGISSAKPTDAWEALVVKCMSEVLNSTCVGVKDHFFSLGGDSFDAAVLASRLEEATNKTIDMAHIFEHPTAEALSLVIQQLPLISKLEIENKDGKIPATSEQLAIWYGMHAAPQPSVYQIHLTYHIQGNLDRDRLTFSLNALKSRYDALQLSFSFPQNTLMQTREEYHFHQLEQISAHTWKLEVMFHHLICDEQSIALFMQELSDLYNNAHQTLPPVGSYAQYSLEQEHAVPSHALAFWKKELPLNTTPMGPDRKAGYHLMAITSHLRGKILDFSKDHDVTPFTLLLTVFSISFRLFSQEDRFLVGTPFSTRKSEKIFGLFIHLLPMSFAIQNETKFSELLIACKKKVSDTFKHRFIPFYRIQEKLGSSIHLNVIFNWNRRMGQTPRLNGVEVTCLATNSHFSEFDMSFIVEEDEDKYQINIQYASQIYENWRIKLLGENFIEVLEKILAQPDLLIAELSPSSRYETSRISVDEQRSLIEMIEAVAPHLIAIENEDVSLTYQVFNERVNQLAHHLIRKGMRSNKGAVICLEDPLEQIIATLAALKTGGYFIPLDHRDPIEYRKSIIEDVKPFFVIDQFFLEKLDDFPKTNPGIAISLHDIAYIIYTSGSTGKPKGVIIEHGGLSHRVFHAKHLLTISSNSRILSQISPAFDMHIAEWGFALANGATLCPHKKGIAHLWSFISRMRVSHVILTPGVLSLLPNDSLDHLKYLLVGGEVTPQNLMEKWSQKVTVVNGYGPTECTLFTHMHAFNSNQSARIIGRSICGVDCLVIDDKGGPVHEGGVGELYIRGIGITKGYVGREAFTDRQFKTGDLVRVLPDGLLEYVGRQDYLVKINGCRVDIHLIENKIMALPHISEVAVVSIRMSEDKSALACYYSGERDCATIIRKHLRKQLPAYMIPTQYFYVERLPRLLSGKLDREKLKSIKVNHPPVACNWSDTESKLGTIWHKLLGEKPRHREEDFFQIGGDSLRSVQLIIEIEKTWGVEILMPELRDRSNLAELAQFIESRQINSERQTVIPLQTTGSRIPLFLVHPSIGLVECYRSLSEQLQEQPIYGVQNPFIAHQSTRFSSLFEMARHYSAEIKKAHPIGPYRMGGWSFGGVVALEVASILKGWGESIERVILLDSYAPEIDMAAFPLAVNSEDLLLESRHNNKLLREHKSSCYEGLVYLIRASNSVLSNNGWHFLSQLFISEVAIEHHEMFDLKHTSKMTSAIEFVLQNVPD